MNGVSLLEASLWPSTGLIPASPFSLTELHMPGVASAEWKGDSCQFLGPAGTVLLTQPKMQLAITATKAHCWLTVSLLLSRTPKPFSASIPAPMRAGACSCSGLAEFPEVPLSPFLQLIEVCVDGSTLSAASAPAPVCTSSKLAVEHSASESMSFMKMLNSVSTSTVPEPSTGDCLQLEVTLLVTNHWAGSSVSFKSTSLST